MKHKKPSKTDGFLCRHRPIFPGGFPPSIFGTDELNYRVRNGNGWTLIVNDTDSIMTVAKLQIIYNLVTRTRFELVLPA